MLQQKMDGVAGAQGEGPHFSAPHRFLTTSGEADLQLQLVVNFSFILLL